jgi:transposase
MVLLVGGVILAFFLKKSKLKNGLYLQIYESYYNPDKKETSHRSHKALGYAKRLVEGGIDDPVSHFSAIVKQMNAEVKRVKQEERDRQISQSPEKHLGYFLIKAVFDGLGVSGFLDFLQSIRGFRFNISELIEALVYSRMIDPCSKSRTHKEVIPSLLGKYDFSYGQILDGVEFIGSEYEKVIEIFNHQLSQKFPHDTSSTFFDGTNFYFEIDKEDDLRRKGPSKENRKDPIVGMGLLLDARQIPIGMKLYPGNQSEMPVIREVFQNLKNRNNIKGRTIQVADKGLNCAKNILEARKNGDGYIFSKSVKKLPATEKTWVMLTDGFRDVLDKEKNLLYRIKECVDKFPYAYEDESGKKTTVMLTEKRVVVFSPKLAKKKRLEINRMVEKAKLLKAYRAKKEEFGECGKYVTFTTTDKKGNSTDGKVTVTLNRTAIDEDLKLAGYNLFVTSETKMTPDEIYSTYRNLWRIEESFKIMKSYLDARPVFLQKTNSIYGHFLICYLSVLMLRVLQFHVFDNKFCTERFIEFVEKFRLVEVAPNKYINISPASDFITELSDKLALPLTSFYLDSHQIEKVLKLMF